MGGGGWRGGGGSFGIFLTVFSVTLKELRRASGFVVKMPCNLSANRLTFPSGVTADVIYFQGSVLLMSLNKLFVILHVSRVLLSACVV
jgi:hypothetical protein